MDYICGNCLELVPKCAMWHLFDSATMQNLMVLLFVVQKYNRFNYDILGEWVCTNMPMHQNMTVFMVVVTIKLSIMVQI